MSIKMIVVDMDGTFLNSESAYDKTRFMRIFEELQKRNIYFVVASGNPYKQLQESFKEIKDKLIYVSENGGYIVDKGAELYLSHLEEKDSHSIIEVLKTMPDVLSWACTKDQSYTLESIPEKYYEMFLPYFPGVKKVKEYSFIQNSIIKFALYLPNNNVKEIISHFEDIMSSYVRVTDSGRGCIDLVPSHVNKGVAVEYLMERFHLRKEEVMAFGDAGNDEEMLKRVGYGYVMDNAKEEFKKQFEYVAPSHNNQGVLAVIDKYLDTGSFINLK